MTLNLTIPQQMHTDFTPRITVIGVGGGGTNAVDNMISLNLQGVDFVVANTDAQQLMHSRADRRIQLGPHITQGLGAGAKPEIGRAAAEEAADDLYRHLDGVHMVFVTAGMGGGTGTGAAPVIARMARERNILTVGVVTKPFSFEGSRRARAADQGIEELQQYVDTLIVIPNQNLFRMANERTTWKEAFKMADHVLYMGVRGVTDLMMAPGLVNLDFADIRTVMAEMGKAMMGTGEAEGENRAIRASEAAISNPLLEDTSMAGARGLLINITGGDDMTLFEVDQAANRIREEVDEDANIIFGSAIDEGLAGRIRVSVVATGIDTPAVGEQQRPRLVAVSGGAPTPMAVPMPAPGLRAAAPAAGPAGFDALSGLVPSPLRGGLSAAVRTAAEGMISGGIGGHSAPVQPQIPGAPVLTASHTRMEARPTGQPGLQNGLQPGPQPGPVPRGLFAEPMRPPQAANPGLPAGNEPIRPSLFKAVTGAFRRSMPPAASTAAEASPRIEAMAQEPRPETVRPSVKQAAGEEMGLDIPAFLRRQSS